MVMAPKVNTIRHKRLRIIVDYADVQAQGCGLYCNRKAWTDADIAEHGEAILGGLGCSLIRREGQRFFSSLVNEPHPSQWAATNGARSVSLSTRESGWVREC